MARWIGVTISITKWMSDDPQPGIVEAELIDALGTRRRYVEKQSFFERLDFDAETTYPQSGVLLCRVLNHKRDSQGRDVVTVELYDGVGTQIDVFPHMMVEGVYNSPVEKPWNGIDHPNSV